MNSPKVSLDQWQILQAVGEAGSFQAAADRLHKSQSTVSYAVHQLQEKLGITLFEYRGRRAHLTESGKLVMRRASQLVEQAGNLEQAALDLARGCEPQISLVVDVIFPQEVVLEVLEAFLPQSHGARIELYTEALSGTHELLMSRQVDLALCGTTPTGYLAQPLLEVNMVAVAHPGHELFARDNAIEELELARYRQIVVRDSGSYRRLSSGWLGSEERWTVSDFRDSLASLRRGLGFSFVPKHLIGAELASGELRVLPLVQGSERRVITSLVFADRENAGPGTRALAELLVQACANRASALV
jgi:DNA-binding transcriptional LysR family regulator